MLNLLRDESVLVLGLGDSGLAMAAWAHWQGAARVQVWDSRDHAPQDAALRTFVPKAERLQGELQLTALDGVSRVLKSPGLAPLDVRIAPLLAAARERGVALQGELDLFAQALAALKSEWQYAPHVLAITGTNGKTTTTSLTGQLCAAAGLRVAVAGNIGPTLLDTLSQALRTQGHAKVAEQAQQLDLVMPEEQPDAPAEDDGVSMEQLDELLEQAELPIQPPPPRAPEYEHLPQVWVLELSSFQLDGVRDFEPSAAVVLNITQDHLDWHGDMQAYAAAKGRIYGSQALMVINRDDALVEGLVPTAPPPPVGARGKPLKVSVKWTPRSVCRFGLNAPQAPGDFGLIEEAGVAWLVRALPLDETPSLRKKRGAAQAEEELQIQRLMPADALRIRGRHNSANALAALALATEIGCPLAPMLHALRDYQGEPHRVEWVLTLDGVDFVDDSKGTNVGATVAAIAGLGADREGAKLCLVLGGDGKGQDFSPLREPILRHARSVALIGKDAEELAALLQGGSLSVGRFASLEEATRWSYAQAQGGDTVLLSPACASLDMFRNYAHRAEVFVAAAQELVAERGGLAL
ncbi:UDP-N-acetylmuramoylalanine--D-glutamate ligase [Inhella inkyongensis]|uniref:UDP-N-acetylmuramoylalanine--D-glutamate ligase n=1 Tax=Inhella inkyongensis TaxID=392593 RepID=A0A840S2Z5_9BURK|nr:UDP-N-acetylmuramoyl-L-alanine--D-glutamate ligase [Inhella inkyongensis]MBB5203446.1 UDP-N-acetylmuramoylalanine--D-glutamate ligase [Inhella inkyongensis]